MERVKQYLVAKGFPAIADRTMILPVSGATVELSVVALNCEPGAIAKAVCLVVKNPAKIRYDAIPASAAPLLAEAGQSAGPFTPTASSPVREESPTGHADEAPNLPVIIVCAGDTKLNQGKFKKFFACPPKMVKKEDCPEASGHPVGAVCPFAVAERTQVFLDISITRFERLFPAVGQHNAGVWVTPQELQDTADHLVGWVDVCEVAEPKPASPASPAEARNVE